MKLTKTKLFNSKGMSLLAVLIASAVGAVIVIGMTQYQSNLLTSINQIKQEANLTIFRSEITRKFKSNDYKTCTDTVRNFVDSSNNIKDRSIINGSTTLYSAGQVRNSSSIKIQKIQVRAGTANDKKIKLYVYFTTNKKNQPYLPISFPLVLPADVSYDISSSSSSLIVKECTGGGGATSPPIAATPDCLTAEISDAYKKTLLGCGTTKDNKGRYTVALGYNAGSSNSTGAANNFLGYVAGYRNTSGGYNNFLGYVAGYYNKTGTANNFIGYYAGYRNINGAYNNFLGNQAGYYNTSGHTNNFIGYRTGYRNSSGYSNNFLGNQAGYYNSSGRWNNFIGYRTGYRNTSGYSNNFIGRQAGYNNRTGKYNIFIGYHAAYNNTSGSNNLCLGIETCTSLRIHIGRLIIETSNSVSPTSPAGTPSPFPDNLSANHWHNYVNSVEGHWHYTSLKHKNYKNIAVLDQDLLLKQEIKKESKLAKDLTIKDSKVLTLKEKPIQSLLSLIKSFLKKQKVSSKESKLNKKPNLSKQQTKDLDNQALDNQELSNQPNLDKSANLSNQPNYYFKKGSKLIEYDSSFNEVVALGSKAGYMNSGDKNVFVGSHSGKYNLIGEHNTFLGYNSGAYTQLGSYNIYIGSSVGASKKDSSSYPKKQKDYQLSLGNTLYGNLNKKGASYPFPIKDSSLVFDSHLTISKDLEVIGNIKTKKDIKILGSLKAAKANIKIANINKAKIKYLEVDYLKVNNPQRYLASNNQASYQNPLSSKQYKKNIESYKNHEESLNKILNIKLYNYHYKDKVRNPNKQRMGVISEYLDPIFQLKDNNISKTKANNKSIIMPDWPTIYGSLIASVKAIYSKLTNLIKDFQDFKTLISSQVDKTNKELIKANKELKDSNNRFNKELDKTNKQLKDSNNKFNKELLNLKQEILELKKQMEVSKQIKKSN